MRKGPLYTRASQLEKRLALSGIPKRYLECTPDVFKEMRQNNAISVISFTYDRDWKAGGIAKQITQKVQKKLIASVLSTDAMKNASTVVGVGSLPTDKAGMMFAAAVTHHAFSLNLKVRAINGRWPTSLYESKIASDPPDVAILYNIKEDCSSMRAEAVKDWLYYLDDTFTIIVVSGTHPLPFIYQRLHHPIDAALLLQGD